MQVTCEEGGPGPQLQDEGSNPRLHVLSAVLSCLIGLISPHPAATAPGQPPLAPLSSPNSDAATAAAGSASREAAAADAGALAGSSTAGSRAAAIVGAGAVPVLLGFLAQAPASVAANAAALLTALTRTSVGAQALLAHREAAMKAVTTMLSQPLPLSQPLDASLPAAALELLRRLLQLHDQPRHPSQATSRQQGCAGQAATDMSALCASTLAPTVSLINTLAGMQPAALTPHHAGGVHACLLSALDMLCALAAHTGNGSQPDEECRRFWDCPNQGPLPALLKLLHSMDEQLSYHAALALASLASMVPQSAAATSRLAVTASDMVFVEAMVKLMGLERRYEPLWGVAPAGAASWGNTGGGTGAQGQGQPGTAHHPELSPMLTVQRGAVRVLLGACKADPNLALHAVERGATTACMVSS